MDIQTCSALKNLNFNFLGYGVFVTEDVSPWSFLCQYPGEVITLKERGIREEMYEKRGDGCYLFDMEHHNKRFWYVSQ